MQLNLAAVDDRKEVAADQHEQRAAKRQHEHGGNGYDQAARQERVQKLRIGGAHGFEAVLERREQAPEPALRSLRPVPFALEQQADGDRRQRPRKGVGRQHREHHRQAERGEEIFCRTVEEHDRNEHAADRQRRNQRRHGDFGGAVQRRPRQRLVLFGEQPVRVLDRDRGVVDQNADGEREPAERHRIDGVAEEIQNDQRGKDREWNRDHDDDGGPPRPEEQQDHQRGQPGGNCAFTQQSHDRGFDEHRLIEQLLDLHAGRRRLARDHQGLLDRIDHCQRRRVAVLDDAEQHGAPAVGAHDILLHGVAVVHLADVLHEHGLPVDVFHRDVVEVGDFGRHRVGAHGELRVADLGQARGQRQVLSVDCVDHVERGQSFRLQLERVDIDHDLPILAAGRGRERDAVDRRQLLPQTVDAVVVELLLVERV